MANPNSQQSVRQEILDSLTEMFPDTPPGDLARTADALAKEYAAERANALREITAPKQPAMVPSDYQDEWRWDGNKPVPVTDEYRQSQRDAQKKWLDESSEKLRQQEAARNRYKQPVRGGLPGGKRIGPVRPGDARPIQPSEGTRYGESEALEASYKEWVAAGKPGYDPSQRYTQIANEWGNNGGEIHAHREWVKQRGKKGPQARPERSKQDLYWQYLESGMSPQEAQRAASTAFAYEPKEYSPPKIRKAPIRANHEGSPDGGQSGDMYGAQGPGVRQFPASGRGLGGPMSPDQLMAAWEDQQFRYGQRKDRALMGLTRR